MNKENEVFMPIKGYEGHYSISNYGRVYSHRRTYPRRGHDGSVQVLDKEPQILKSFNNSVGYPIIVLKKLGKRKTFLIHRLVALAFLSNPYNKEYVNHKDGNKENALLTNLEWCSRLQNKWHDLRYLHSDRVKNWVLCASMNHYFVNAKEAAYYTGQIEEEIKKSMKSGEKLNGFSFEKGTYEGFRKSSGLE